jgi:large subunit ribosomal protein L27
MIISVGINKKNSFISLRIYPMATSKSGGSTQNNRESHSKRLGCKIFDGHKVFGGEIIVRQRGTHIHPGKQVLRGGDDTLFVTAPGVIKFHYGPKGRKYVSVISSQ